MKQMRIPPVLKPGDKIAIISPASVVRQEYVDGAAEFLKSRGFEPVVMPHANGPAHGSYAAFHADRLADLTAAYSDPQIRAVLCARGGYGCNHLLPLIPEGLMKSDPKWLIGFSDISALHAYSQSEGVVSLHSPMAKHLTEHGAGDYSTESLMKILTSGLPVEYESETHPLSRTGECEGIIRGGNLAVCNGLATTPFDPLCHENCILLIEDVSEQIYAVERMLIRLRMAGVFDNLRGLVVGQFTEYRAPDRNHADMEHMIAEVVADYSFPVAMGFPVGHVERNLPIPLGANTRLEVGKENTRIIFG